MFAERESSSGETTPQERRDGAQPDSRVLGRVVQCDGARAVALHDPAEHAAVGLRPVPALLRRGFSAGGFAFGKHQTAVPQFPEK